MSAPESQPANAAGEFYDDVWERYGKLDAASPAAFHRRRLVIDLCTRHAAGARQVLDAGCGRGELLRELTLRFPQATVCASDVSLASVREAQRLNPSLEVVHMDLSAQDFNVRHARDMARFELITCSEVVEHIPDDCLAVERVARLLAPGGTLVLTVPGGKMSRFDQLIGHHRHYSAKRLRELAEHANLDLVDVLAWGFPFQNLYRSLVRLVSRVSLRRPGVAAEASEAAAGKGARISAVLGTGYAGLGRALKPLFYLNRNYWGEQMLLVARKR